MLGQFSFTTVTVFEAFHPFDKSTVVDCKHMYKIISRWPILERCQEPVENIISGFVIPRCCTVQIKSNQGAIGDLPFQHSFRRLMPSQIQACCKVLQQGSLSVSGIST